MKKIYSFLALCMLLLSAGRLQAQCTAPTTIGTPVVQHASCPGNGRIIVNSVTPAVSAPDYFQYALYQSSTEIKPWQNSDTFRDVNAGIYEIRVRKVCNLGFSSFITRSVTVNNTEAAPSISNISVERYAWCNNGRFRVTATGSASREYALVNSLTEPEPIANYIRPRQSSSIFDSLPAGTYYVRVYNGCNNAATQAVTVPAYTTASYIDLLNVKPLSCDSFALNVLIANFLNISNTRDTALSKWWINWPTGMRDTVPTITSPASGISSNWDALFSYSKLSNAVAAGSFPNNLTGWPFTITAGYRDVCGNVYFDTLVINKPNSRSLIVSSNENNALSNCDQLAYQFKIEYAPAMGIGTGEHYFTNTDEVMFSVDNGLTWQQAYTGINKNVYSDYFSLSRNTSLTLKVALCGDTLSRTFTTDNLPPLIIVPRERNLLSCTGKTGIDFYSFNVNGAHIGIKMNSAPAGQAIVPYFEIPFSSSANGYPAQLQQLLPGTYNLTFYDTLGVDCPRQTTVNITIANAATLSGTVERQCNGDLWVMSTTTVRYNGSTNALGSSMKAEVFNSSGIKVLPAGFGTYMGSMYTLTGYTTAIIPVAEWNALPDGSYTIRIKKQPNASTYPYLDTCAAVAIPWNKANYTLNLDASRFVNGCPGGSATIVAAAQGGKAPYTYNLRDATGNLVAPSSANNIYNNLVGNATYTLQVIDVCGAVVNRTMSVSGALPIFASSDGPAVCEGNKASLMVYEMPGVTYQWQKNSINIPGANNPALTFNVVTFPQDAGAYKAQVNMGNCVVFTSSFILSPGQCTPLPVSLLLFTARAEDNKAVLNWSTASEQNNKGFYVERSTDGQKWENITFINSKAVAGNSLERSDYTYADVNRNAAPLYYYRLNQLDLDGLSVYSEVQRVSFRESNKQYYISPNPATEIVTVAPLQGAEKISIYGSLDNLVRVDHAGTAGAHSLNIRDLAPGLYLVHIQNKEGQIEVLKLIVE